jgi:hypothetical protein
MTVGASAGYSFRSSTPGEPSVFLTPTVGLSVADIEDYSNAAMVVGASLGFYAFAGKSMIIQPEFGVFSSRPFENSEDGSVESVLGGVTFAFRDRGGDLLVLHGQVGATVEQEQNTAVVGVQLGFMFASGKPKGTSPGTEWEE